MEEKYILIIAFGSAGLLFTIVLVTLIVYNCRQWHRRQRRAGNTVKKQHKETKLNNNGNDIPLDRETCVTKISERNKSDNHVSSLEDGSNKTYNGQPIGGTKKAKHDPTRGHAEQTERGNDDNQLSKETKVNETHMQKYCSYITPIDEAAFCILDEGVTDVESRSLGTHRNIVPAPVQGKTKGGKENGETARAKMPMFPKVRVVNNKVEAKTKSSHKDLESNTSDYLTPVYFTRKSVHNYEEIQEPMQPGETFMVID